MEGNQESGEVSEWLKEHAWKVCIRQRIEGSNPSLSARYKNARASGLFYIWRRERFDENPTVRPIAPAIRTAAGAPQGSKREMQSRFESIPLSAR